MVTRVRPAADQAVYAALDANAKRLGNLFRLALSEAGVANSVQYAGNLVSVFFGEPAVRDYAGAQASETWRVPPFFHALLDGGVYAPPSAYEAWFVNVAMDEEAFSVIEAALPAAAQAAAGAVL